MPKLRMRLYGRQPHSPPQAGVPLPISWEQAFENLTQLPRMFAEPDGSFLWSGTDPTAGDWQVEGTVFDDGQVVRRVELVGNCNQTLWLQLLGCFACDWDSVSLEDLTHNSLVDGHWLQSVALG